MNVCIVLSLWILLLVGEDGGSSSGSQDEDYPDTSIAIEHIAGDV